MEKNSYYELEQDKLTQNLIQELGPTCYPLHYHKKIEITYITSGESKSIINNKEYKADADDIIYVSEYHAHSYETSDTATRIVLLPSDNFWNEISQLLNNKTFPCLINNKAFNKDKILPILNELLDVYENESIHKNAKQLLIHGLINTFYGRLLQEYSPFLVGLNKQSEIVASILSYIEEHYMDKLTLDSLAKKFSYSKFYFSKIFNENIGINISNYINKMRINKFVSFFKKNPDCNITKLALDVGFDSASSFYRAFQNVYNCTPKEFLIDNSIIV